MQKNTMTCLFAVLVKFWKLSKQVDKGSFAEGMFDRGMEGDGGVLGAQQGHPFLGYPGRHKVYLVEN